MLEITIVVAIMMIVAGITVMSTREVYRNQRAERALQDMLATTRGARQLAIDRRRVFKVTFTNTPATMTVNVTPAANSSGGCAAATNAWPETSSASPVNQLDGYYDFLYVSGAPNGATTSPDGLANGKTNGINFTSTFTPSAICFYPDGSARDVNNQFSSGLIYLAPSTTSESSTTVRLKAMRAMTIFGPTGRVSGWRLSQTSSGMQWKQW